MNESAERIMAAADAVVDALRDASVRELDGPKLVAAHAAAASVRRAADAAIVELSAEIERRSRPELGADGLARKNGFRSAGVLVSAATGTSVGEAHRMIQVGAATTPRMLISGDVGPARRPHVGTALRATTISVAAAGLITGMLDRVAVRADAEKLDAMERMLAAQAPGLTLDQVAKIVARAEAHLDPDRLEPKLDELHTARTLTIRQDSGGMVVLTAHLDPETAAPVKAAIEGIVTAQLRQQRRRAGSEATAEDPDATEPPSDPRSIKQLQADALADVCRQILGCDLSKPLATPTTTVIVRVDLATLQSGTGVATIDGHDQPISAGAARRMAVAAQVIPCVLGGRSEILDWGRAARLFSYAQRLALLERDGGCAFCGAPPGFAEAHHILYGERHRGPTDLSNGVILCTACHHRVHADEWEIRIEGTGRDAGVVHPAAARRSVPTAAARGPATIRCLSRPGSRAGSDPRDDRGRAGTEEISAGVAGACEDASAPRRPCGDGCRQSADRSSGAAAAMKSS